MRFICVLGIKGIIVRAICVSFHAFFTWKPYTGRFRVLFFLREDDKSQMYAYKMTKKNFFCLSFDKSVYFYLITTNSNDNNILYTFCLYFSTYVSCYLASIYTRRKKVNIPKHMWKGLSSYVFLKKFFFVNSFLFCLKGRRNWNK